VQAWWLGPGTPTSGSGDDSDYSALPGGDCIEDGGAGCGWRPRPRRCWHGGGGTVHARDIPEIVHLGTCRPAGPGVRRVDPPFMQAGAGPVWGRSHWMWTRTICEDLRAQEARCPLRLHQCAWVSPTPGDGCRHRRGRGRAPAGRQTPIPVGGVAGFLTQVLQPFVRRAGVNRAMVLRADSGFYSSKVTQACAKAGGELLVYGQNLQGIAQGDRRHRRGGLDTIPYWIDDRCRGGRDNLPALLPQAPEVRLIRATGEAHPRQPAGVGSQPTNYHAFITDREDETALPRAVSPPPRRASRT